MMRAMNTHQCQKNGEWRQSDKLYLRHPCMYHITINHATHTPRRAPKLYGYVEPSDEGREKWTPTQSDRWLTLASSVQQTKKDEGMLLCSCSQRYVMHLHL